MNLSRVRTGKFRLPYVDTAISHKWVDSQPLAVIEATQTQDLQASVHIIVLIKILRIGRS